jgi:16S rRNA (uracil1498-N3)-methyltransferase
MIEASEQCGRGDVPSLGETVDLETALSKFPEAIAFDLSGKSIFEVLGSPRSELGQTVKNTIAFEILIGPEGGWSDKELALIKDRNIKLAKLGDTTLRAETAAIVSCAQILSL